MGTNYLLKSFDSTSKYVEDTLRYLLDNHICTDVTLSTDCGETIQAHRLVLCSNSDFLKNILLPNDNCTVMLPGVKITELQSILRFIYLGESEVAVGDLEGFLRIGQELSISGLTEEVVLRKGKAVKNNPDLNEPKTNAEDENYKHAEIPSFNNIAVGEPEAIFNEQHLDNADNEVSETDERMNKCENKLKTMEDKHMEYASIFCKESKVDSNISPQDKQIEEVTDIISYSPNDESETIFIENFLEISVNEEMETFGKSNNCKDTGPKMEANKRENKSSFSEMSKAKVETENNVKCKLCGYISNHKSILRQHVLAVHEGFKFDCDKCDYKSGYISRLKMHKESVHEGIEYSCNKCEYKTGYKDQYKSHLKHVHSGNIYSCQKCDYRTRIRINFKKHTIRMHSTNKVKCPNCDQEATCQEGLRYHIKTKHEGERFNCDQCENIYYTNKNLKMHKLKVHDGVSIRFNCEICLKSYTETSRLKKHIRSKHPDTVENVSFPIAT